nr:putative ribonuclease H-like domain-containing protein [Tanacetum cinerariifolium]
MTRNKAHLADYQEFKGGSVAFGGSNGKIIGSKLDFEDVYYVEELKHYNLFSVSQMYDKKNKFLFTDTDCLVLSPNFKLPDKSQVLLKIPRQHNIKESNTRRLVRPRQILVGYSLNSKAFRVSNLETKSVEENLHVNFLENKPNVAGKGHAWMFDLDYLTNSINYEPVFVENQVGTQANDDQGATSEEIDLQEEHFVLPIWSTYSTTVKSSGDKIKKNTDFKTCEKSVSQVEQIFLKEIERLKRQEKEANDAPKKETTHENHNAHTNNTNLLNTVSTPLSATGPSRAFNDGEPLYPDDPLMPHLEDIYASPSERIFTESSFDDEGVVTDFNNLETTMNVSLTTTTRIHTIHPKTQILEDPMQEEGIDYGKVFALVSRIKAIRIFLAFASYMGFIVYQMDVKSALLYGTIDEEVYVTQPPGFVDPKFPNKVYKQNGYRRGAIDKTLFIKQDKQDIMLAQVYVDDIIFGSTNKSWCDESKELMKNSFQMSFVGELTLFLELQVKQKEDGIFITHDKYIAEILKKFDFLSVKTTSTLIETQKLLFKDEEAADVDVHLYRSMIGSLMYLTASKPDIMFAVCACSRFQVTPKTSHLQAMKRIFRYLKRQPKLGLWYPKVSSFDMEAYSDSDYVSENLDWKYTIGCCQFLGRKLISWQCKKQTIVATSIIEAEYVAVVHCCGQVLWIQNQLLDYGFNIMNTKIYIDNESTICIVKNPVFHSKTNHIEIRHHFIRNAYEKNLIQVLKIYTDDNVADLLTKAFDVSSKELASPKKMTLSQDKSNLFMAGSLPKTKCYKLMLFGLMKDAAVNLMLLELTRMGYEKPPSKLTFYKAFFSTQWKFLIHTLVQCVSANRTAWNEFSCSITFAIICLTTELVREFQEWRLLYLHECWYNLKLKWKKMLKDMCYIVPKSCSVGTRQICLSIGDFQALKEAQEVREEEDIKVFWFKEIKKGAELQGRKDDDNAATKDVSAAERTVLDDEEVTMTMAQTLIKLKAKKARLLDEQIAKRKNMIIYLKNIAGYKMEHFRGMTYDKESFKKLKEVKVSGSHSTQDTPTNDHKEMSEEDVKNMLEIVPVSEFKVEALQLKYPLIDWEIHSE